MATHVFYSPHTDDESIGMAGSILRAKAEGHRVLVVLVTDNRPSARGEARWPGIDLAAARLAEFREALARLGVDYVRYLGLGEKTMMDDREFALAVLLGELSAIDHEFEGSIVHHTVRGADDIHRELGRSTLAHRLCEEAARLFSRSRPNVDVFLHAIYAYSFPPTERGAPLILELTAAELMAKRHALEAYKAGDGRIGYGYDSVYDLIDAASIDTREYMWKL